MQIIRDKMGSTWNISKISHNHLGNQLHINYIWGILLHINYIWGILLHIITFGHTTTHNYIRGILLHYLHMGHITTH